MEYLERKINVFKPNYIEPLYVVQGSNMLTIKITFADWDIPTGATVKWQVITSTKGELNNATFEDNTVSIVPYNTTFSEAGKGYLQLRVEKDEKVLVSFAIDVYIFRDRLISPVEGSNSDVVKVLVDQYVEEATGTLFEDLEAQAQSELASIRATGQSVLDSIPAEYSELEDATYNAYPLGTAEGNPIIIEDGSDNIPVKSLSVDLVPKQDLNGYDHPWIGGAGKNLINIDAFRKSGTSGGITVEVHADENYYTFKGTATLTNINVWFIGSYNTGQNVLHLDAGTYYYKGINLYERDEPVTSLPGGRDGGFFTLTSPIDIDGIRAIGATVGETYDEKVYPYLAKVDDTSIVPPFTPYENICPITGYDVVTVKRTGKNLAIRQAGNTIIGHAIKGETYTFSFVGGTKFSLKKNATSGDYVVMNQTSPVTFTADEDFDVYFNPWTVIGISNIQLELGTTATEYEPYIQSKEYSITFPTEVGTVYGGTLNMTTGELVVDKKMEVINKADGISRNNAKQYYLTTTRFPDIKHPTSAELTVISNKFKPSITGDGVIFLNVGGNVRFNTTKEYASTADMIADIESFEVCYPLATPQTYQLTPTEVSTLLGYNVIQSDGDMDLEYRADIVDYYTGMNDDVALMKDITDYIDTSKEFSVKENRILECDVPNCTVKLSAYLNGSLSHELEHRDTNNGKAYFPLSPKYTYQLTVNSEESYSAKLVVESQRALFVGGLYNGTAITSTGNKRTNLINAIRHRYIRIDCEDTVYVDGFKDGKYVGRKVAFRRDIPSKVNISEYDYICMVSHFNEEIFYTWDDVGGLFGKKWVSYGDSITQGNKWQNYLVEKYGLIHTNKGVGGSCVTGETESTVAPMTDSDRINSIDTDTDIITVMGGTNDHGYCTNIGTIEDLQESYNEATFMGSLAIIVKKLQARCPNARIILMSLINSRGVTGQNSDNQQVSKYGYTAYDFAVATRQVAEWLSVDYIDTWSCGINQLNRAKYISDSVHPNDEGGKMIAFKIMQYFDTLEV